MSDKLARAQEILQELWGFPSLKPAQAEVIEHLLNGDDVLAVLATGYGKSVTFQIPAVMGNGCCIVVSPLIALMKDQVDNANAKGIPSAFVNSHLEPDEEDEAYANLKAGAYKLFYIAPERLNNRRFRGALSATDVSLIAVDEAHCASMWGHDFRPAYKRLSELGDIMFEATGDRPPILAVTATATNDIEDDIATALGMSEEYERIVGDPIRPNIFYDRVVPRSSEWGVLRQEIESRFHLPGRHLIYCGTQKATKLCAQIIEEAVGKAGFYHGGMTKEDRQRVQDDFSASPPRLPCIAATNAFGMGIDVPDIRTVIHLGVPGSLESYVQETGRAGRDGQDSKVVLIQSDFAVELQRRFIDDANPPIDAYARVWEWLQETIEPGDSLRMSAASISGALGGGIRNKLTAAQISTILNVLEGHGLVRRQYFTGGTPVRMHFDAFDEKKFSGNTLLVGRHLHASAQLSLKKKAHELPSSAMLDIDKRDVAGVLGIAPATLNAHLRKLADEGVVEVGETFTGKTTSIRLPDADLHEHIPIEQLEAKRKRDNDRFAAMLSYQSASDPKKFIRDYFEGRAVKGGRRVAEDDDLPF